MRTKAAHSRLRMFKAVIAGGMSAGIRTEVQIGIPVVEFVDELNMSSRIIVEVGGIVSGNAGVGEGVGPGEGAEVGCDEG